MLFDPMRHEALLPIEWDEQRVRATIARIAADVEAHYSDATYWPLHPCDLEPADDPNVPATSLYFSACGVLWALHYLESMRAIELSRNYLYDLPLLVERNRTWLASIGSRDFGSFL